jgi:mannose-6-phosphate isomerase-like protein (cupin superfamily)
MTLPLPPHPLIVHAHDAETLPLPGGGRFTLLEDAEHTDGLFGANQLTLPAGTDGTRPHHHTRSTEFFHILSGSMDFLISDRLTTVTSGDLVVVPPRTVHAFGATADGPAAFFAVLTPGIARFEYFRQLARIARGEAGWDSMEPLHETFDVHFDGGSKWR